MSIWSVDRRFAILKVGLLNLEQSSVNRCGASCTSDVVRQFVSLTFPY